MRSRCAWLRKCILHLKMSSSWQILRNIPLKCHAEEQRQPRNDAATFRWGNESKVCGSCCRAWAGRVHAGRWRARRRSLVPHVQQHQSVRMWCPRGQPSSGWGSCWEPGALPLLQTPPGPEPEPEPAQVFNPSAQSVWGIKNLNWITHWFIFGLRLEQKLGANCTDPRMRQDHRGSMWAHDFVTSPTLISVSLKAQIKRSNYELSLLDDELVSLLHWRTGKIRKSLFVLQSFDFEICFR